MESFSEIKKQDKFEDKNYWRSLKGFEEHDRFGILLCGNY
jgi:hypothetical protein